MSAVSEAEARGTLGTVRNAVVLLNLLSEGPAYQHLTDLAERSQLSVPTVHRLLRSLSVAGLVEQDASSAKYGLGPELVRLSYRYLTRLPILTALAPYLAPLRDAVGGTVQVAVLVRGNVVYVDRVDSADSGPYRHPHRVHEAASTPAGRLLLGGESTPYLLGDGEAPGLNCEIAVPVVDGQGRTVGALAATVGLEPSDKDVEAVVAQLSRAAQAAGRSLGHV